MVACVEEALRVVSQSVLSSKRVVSFFRYNNNNVCFKGSSNRGFMPDPAVSDLMLLCLCVWYCGLFTPFAR